MPHQTSNPHLYSQKTDSKGTGLFTSKAIPAGELVFYVDRPLAIVPDTPHLDEVCSDCFQWLPQGCDNSDVAAKDAHLKACMGCRVVRYCSKACQSRSWKSSHKYECRIYADLHPRILPSVNRIVLQLLLRRHAKSLPESDWEDFLGLQSHLDDMKADANKNDNDLSNWEEVRLMSQAVLSYSRTCETLENVQAMTARCTINGLTVEASTFDALGTCVSTDASQLNHSCNPNCIVIFSGSSISVRSLQHIAEGGELTISYVDVTTLTTQRQSHLRNRYYFTCSCPYCEQKSTCGQPDIPSSLQSELSPSALADLENEAQQLQDRAKDAPAQESILLLIKAMKLFTHHKGLYPIWRHPWPSIRYNMKMAFLDVQDSVSALGHALKAYFYIEPVLFHPDWHPIRVVRKWVLLRIIIEVVYQVESDTQVRNKLGKYQIEWPAVALRLLQEITTAVERGFGKESRFAKEVQRFQRNEIPQGAYGGMEIEDQSSKLRKLADELVE